jgi:hypothetical protein
MLFLPVAEHAVLLNYVPEGLSGISYISQELFIS